MAKKKSGGLLGLGVMAAAAAAGAYFLYGTKEGATKRKQVKGWALKMKGEVLERMENMKEISEDSYHEAIDKVKAKYEGVKSIDTTEVAKVAKEMKSHWKNIKKQFKEGEKNA